MAKGRRCMYVSRTDVIQNTLHVHVFINTTQTKFRTRKQVKRNDAEYDNLPRLSRHELIILGRTLVIILLVAQAVC